ncbi:MAG: ATP-dependent zinc metalloprotease FtsH [Dehalococcoidia bacterium]|nr:MAG: ATP-dependent zinc metalloprotease FtsH [Dehalococcoidia bacterium]
MSSKFLKRGIIYLVVIAALVVLFFAFFPTSPEVKSGSLDDLVALTVTGSVELSDGTVEGNINRIVQEGDTLTAMEGDTQIFKASFVGSTAELYDYLVAREVDMSKVALDPQPPSGFNWGNLLFTLLPLVLFIGVIWFIFSRARGAGNQAMSFGRSKARLFPSTNPATTFNDVAGVDEAKMELQEVVEFLKSPEKFSALGARIPRGVLLVGPPGTGKTLLGRAVAGEAGVPFFSISGSEFVEMFVGVGASRVRDLFDQAKRNSPCIVFIDEIDAVGRHRGAGFGGGHDEREQTLNQILVEMDGFDSSTNVIVVAATNRPDILDPALLRPGRFDRQVVLDRPDIKGRKAILEVHAKGMPLDDSANLEIVAKQTPGFSGADLANLVNEAAILTARRNKKQISLLELEESIDRVIAGPERKSRIISPKEKEITAYHESGHALAARMLPHADPVHKVSIIARGTMGGYTRLLPTEDRYLWTRSQFNDVLATLLGGHCAEELIFHEMTTGSESDIGQATKIARKMVTEYGMSKKLGPRTFGRREELVFLGREIAEQKDYGDRVADEIDKEVQQLIQHAHGVATEILAKNKGKLVQLAEALIANETIEGEELEALFNKPVEEAATEVAPGDQDKSVIEDSLPKPAKSAKKRG